jgi:N-acetylglucosamine kinase-like BadF-type ATPase
LRDLRSPDWDDLQLRIYRAPDDVFPRIFPIVASAAEEGDREARLLLQNAAEQLAELVADLRDRLQLNSEKFLLVKTGGMCGRSRYFDNLLDERLHAAAPRAEFGELVVTLAQAAARMAIRQLPPLSN